MLTGFFLAVTLFSVCVLGWEVVAGAQHHGSVADDDDRGHDLDPAPRPDASLIPWILAFLRRLPWFGFGFGAMGLAGSLWGASNVETIIWAVLVGAGCLGLLSLVTRFQSHQTDSLVSEAELLYETAVVTVPLEPGRLGKVRFDQKGGLVERYALAADPAAALAVGTRVRVTALNDDTVTVEVLHG